MRIMKNVWSVIKIALAVLFFLCLADLPYGFYQFVRFAAMVGFSILAFSTHEKNNQIEMMVYIALALLFQPFFKIVLGRTIWNAVDVVVAIYLVISVFKNPEKKHITN